MTFMFGDSVSVEWDEIQDFVFRKEKLDVTCQEGKKQVSRKLS